jgi:hypothetical protein
VEIDTGALERLIEEMKSNFEKFLKPPLAPSSANELK